MKQVTVVFEPIGLSVQVPAGQSIYQVALKAHVQIDGECGGVGKCGKCQVIIEHQESVSPLIKVEQNALNSDEINAGRRLACQTKILANITIFVPPDISGDSRRIQVDSIDKFITPKPELENSHFVFKNLIYQT